MSETLPTRYIVDGNPVTAESWEALRSSLEGQHEWYCDELEAGGEEGWKATDDQGQWYQVRMLSDESGSTMEITRVDEVPGVAP